MEEELGQLIHRKKELDRNIATLEVQIYNAEGRYLEQTQQFGNAIKGFDGYIGSAAAGGGGAGGSGGLGTSSAASQYAAGIPDTDRLFSHSSSTYKKVICSWIYCFACWYRLLLMCARTDHACAMIAGAANHTRHGRRGDGEFDASGWRQWQR